MYGGFLKFTEMSCTVWGRDISKFSGLHFAGVGPSRREMSISKVRKCSRLLTPVTGSIDQLRNSGGSPGTC